MQRYRRGHLPRIFRLCLGMNYCRFLSLGFGSFALLSFFERELVVVNKMSLNVFFEGRELSGGDRLVRMNLVRELQSTWYQLLLTSQEAALLR